MKSKAILTLASTILVFSATSVYAAQLSASDIENSFMEKLLQLSESVTRFQKEAIQSLKFDPDYLHTALSADGRFSAACAEPENKLFELIKLRKKAAIFESNQTLVYLDCHGNRHEEDWNFQYSSEKETLFYLHLALQLAGIEKEDQFSYTSSYSNANRINNDLIRLQSETNRKNELAAERASKEKELELALAEYESIKKMAENLLNKENAACAFKIDAGGYFSDPNYRFTINGKEIFNKSIRFEWYDGPDGNAKKRKYLPSVDFIKRSLMDHVAILHYPYRIADATPEELGQKGVIPMVTTHTGSRQRPHLPESIYKTYGVCAEISFVDVADVFKMALQSALIAPECRPQAQ